MKMSMYIFGVVLALWGDGGGYALTSGEDCPHGFCPPLCTCCDSRRGFYDCCPVPNAMCCRDGATCCPEGYVCHNTMPNTCTAPDGHRQVAAYSTRNTSVHTSNASKQSLVDGPQENSTNEGHEQRLQSRVNVFTKSKFASLIFRQRLRERGLRKVRATSGILKPTTTVGGSTKCGISICIDNHPCCLWDEQPMCCPYADGVCCESSICCPPGYMCDVMDTTRDCLPYQLTTNTDHQDDESLNKK